jgi:hypothetical protein
VNHHYKGVDTMIVAVDAGKHSTKSKGKSLKVLRSKVDERDSVMDFTGNTYKVVYDGKYYVVGEGAETWDFDVCKRKECHKVAVLVSLALQDAQDVDLAVGVPLSQYGDKDAYSAFYKGTHCIDVNGKPYRINVKSVRAYPESIGAVINNVDIFGERTVGVIDIGGLNVNACIYESLVPSMASSVTLNEGGNIINANIRRALNSELGANYQEYEISNLQRSPNPQAKLIANEALNSRLKRLLLDLKSYGWNIGQIPLYFTGGGSLLLKPQIDAIKYAIVSDSPVWDNVEGFYALREMGA